MLKRDMEPAIPVIALTPPLLPEEACGELLDDKNAPLIQLRPAGAIATLSFIFLSVHPTITLFESAINPGAYSRSEKIFGTTFFNVAFNGSVISTTTRSVNKSA